MTEKISKYYVPPQLESHVYPDHNPRWNRHLPVRPGVVGAGLIVGIGITAAVQKFFVEPLFQGPIPHTSNNAWRQETERRMHDLRMNPIRDHKIGTKVPYDI